MEGFESFVMQKLWDILSQEHKQFRGAEDQVTELKTDLHMLKSFLKDAHAKKHTSAFVKTSVEEIKEIIYDTEDILESFLLKDKLGKTSGTKNLIKRLALSITGRRETPLELEWISKRISKVIHNMKRFGVQQIVVDSGSIVQPLYDRQRAVRQTFSAEYESDALGLEENINKLVEVLVDEEDARVVSIIGMGGAGKTTLARKVFNHEEVKHHFDRIVWVCVSQELTRKYVWQAILQDLKSEEYQKNILEMTEPELQDEIYHLLGTSKSLIVLDDIWRQEDWEQIRVALPPGKGWKVLLTSRKKSITVQGDTRHFYLQLQLLNRENSWNLLKKIAFPKKDASEFMVDEKMENMAKQMIKYCGGLPLAVKVLGGLLAANYTMHDWKRIFERLESGILGAANSVGHMLSLSFEELPHYLKHCFLYLAHFPEGYTINVEKLSYYWAAEGIIAKSIYYNEETILDVGDSYIEELVRRNMVISKRNSESSRFETCHLHDIMREFCLSKANEENFLQIVGNYWSHSTSRRLVSHNPNTLQAELERDLISRKLRSLLIIVGDNMHVDWMVSCSSLTRLHLLRVLDLSKAYLRKLPSSIGDLIHLRYLSLQAAKVSNLPSSLRNLRLLIYLNIEIYTCYIFVPNFLVEMRELRYLALPTHMDGKTKLELTNLVELETLRNFSAKNSSLADLHGMVRLRNLRMLVNDETSIQTLSASIAGLRHMEYLSIEDAGSNRMKEEGQFVLDFIHLKSLELCICIPRLQQLPYNLTYIVLDKCQLEEDPMPNLEKLSHLKVVHLLRQSFCGRRMVCSSGGFTQLEKLELDGLVDLEEWIVEEGSMPILHTLTIHGCEKLKEFPDGLRFMNALKELIADEIWEERLSQEGEDFYKVQHIPTVKYKCR